LLALEESMNIVKTIDFGNREKFGTEEKCVGFLEAARWPEGVRCPACGHAKISRIHAKGKAGKIRNLYQCLEKSCRYQFSATTGTIFHDSHLPLTKWFAAINVFMLSNENVSVNQLRQTLGVQYKTAQHVVQRIREAVGAGTFEVGAERPSNAVALNPPKPVVARAAADRRTVSIPATAFSVMGEVPGKTIGNIFNMFTSLAHMTVRSPWYLANYIITKVSLDT
jgi:transposase-like protein